VRSARAAAARGSVARSCAAQMHAGERLRMPLIEDRFAFVEQLCAQCSSGEVAHVGCADSPYTAELLAAGTLLHSRLVRVASVVGIDVDGPALDLIRRALPGERLLHADVSSSVPVHERGRYQLVIAGEVLEHVGDADAFLCGCAALLAPGGRLCVTVPNACCPKLGLRALVGRESVHPDHRVYYGPRTLTRALEAAGFEVSWMATCFPPDAGVSGRALINPLLRVSHRLFEGPVADGLIAIASARSNAAAIAS
jgi:2-polyprenyl-3-methyl-5-hydroxy-6-metoxy-1,4-benzoquinol methylase